MPNLVAQISLDPADDTVVDYSYLWRILATDLPEDEQEILGGFTDVASEDTEEWTKRADGFLRGYGYKRTGDWSTGPGAALSEADVEFVGHVHPNELSTKIIELLRRDFSIDELRGASDFSELHDLTDANVYIIEAREILGLDGAGDLRDGSRDLALDNAACDLVSAWLVLNASGATCDICDGRLADGDEPGTAHSEHGEAAVCSVACTEKFYAEVSRVGIQFDLQGNWDEGLNSLIGEITQRADDLQDYFPNAPEEARIHDTIANLRSLAEALKNPVDL